MKTLLLFLCFYPIQLWAPPAEMSKQDMIKAWEFNYLMNPFTPAQLNSALKLFVDRPDIAMAQARHESGDFTSAIWKENCNPFGMHHPKIRLTYSTGKNRNCAVYRHWFYAVLDYAEMQKYYYRKGYDHKYFLQVYCPEKNYRKLVYNLL